MAEKAINNVARLNVDSVFADIQSFLRNKGVKSKNTEVAYRNDIAQFFRYIRNKELEELTIDDLILKNAHMLNYQTYLYDEFVQPNGERYSNITINRKINSIIALYGFLKRNEYNVDPAILKVEELPDDSKQIGFLDVDEIDHMLMLTDNEELKAFIMLAVRTSMRKDAILSLRWDQIVPSHDNPDCYVITSMDKGKQVEKDIHKNMYEVLLKLKKDDEYVFHTPRSTMDYQFKALLKKAGIDPRRKVSIHSLKKAGVSYVKELTNDLHAAQMQAGHSSPTTTSKYYVKRQTNIAGMALDVKIDDQIFAQMTHEELLKLVKMQTNGIVHKLKMDAMKIVNSREG